MTCTLLTRAPLALLSWVFWICTVASSSGANPPTVADIADGIRKSDDVLLNSRGFVVRCQRVKSEVITPSRYGGGFLNVELVVAHKDSEWLVQKHFLGGDVVPAGADVLLPPKPLTIAAKGGLIFQWQQSSPTAAVSKFNNGGDLFQCLDYFRHAGVDIAKVMTESNGGDYQKLRQIPALGDYLDHPFLPECLENNASNYLVQSSMESVDGNACWVVEYPGMDKLWLDPTRGYAVLRRIYHWNPGKPRKFEIHNHDFKELAAGLWLPFAQVVDKYASIAAEERSLWDKVTSRMHYQVKEAAVGSVAEEVFKIPIPEGLLVFDDARGIEYRVPAKDVDPFRGPDTEQWTALRERAMRGSRWRALIIAANLVVVVALIAIYFWRKRGASSGPPLILLAAIVYLGGLAPRLASAAQAERRLRRNPPHTAEGVAQGPDRSGTEPLVLFPAEAAPGLRQWQRDGFCWKPEWRSKGDCGPCALFVLMTLEGHQVTYAQVKARIPLDPEKGCSLNSLREAAADLDFPVDVRFVNPKLMTQVPLPCIIHGKASIQSDIGHFAVLVGCDTANGTFDVIDPVCERFSTVEMGRILKDFSGYTIVPAAALRRAWWVRLSDRSLLLSFLLVLLAAAGSSRRFRGRLRVVHECTRSRGISATHNDV